MKLFDKGIPIGPLQLMLRRPEQGDRGSHNIPLPHGQSYALLCGQVL